MMRKKNILIVDDDKEIIKVLRNVFESKDYKVEIAETGREAIKKANIQSFNIALLDIKLPDIDGTQLLAELNKLRPKMIKVIITGHATLKNALESLNLGAAAYLMKPLNLEEVLKIVHGKLLNQEEVERTSKKKRKINFNKVTVVIPTLNEGEAIANVIEEVKGEGFKNILVVDGYSTDETTAIAQSRGAKVVYQHGLGKAGAVKTAVEHVKTKNILFLDGDSTYDPKDIWRLLNQGEHYIHVIGARDKKYINRLHRFGNWVISKVFSMLFNNTTTDVCSGIYLLQTKEIRDYNWEEPEFNVEIELAAQSALRESLTEVPVSYRSRIGAKKLSTWKHGLDILSAAFRLARRYNPILLYSFLTALSIIPAAIILSWVAIVQLTKHVWHSLFNWMVIGVLFLVVASISLTLASVSILIKHSEARLAKELRRLYKTRSH